MSVVKSAISLREKAKEKILLEKNDFSPRSKENIWKKSPEDDAHSWCAQHVRYRFLEKKHVQFILMGDSLHTYIKATTHFRTL